MGEGTKAMKRNSNRGNGRFFALLILLAFTSSAFGQNIPLEDKAKYEKALEEKVNDVLLRVLGPNQAKVVIDASMDFTRIEKFRVSAGAAEGGAGKKELFKWQNIFSEEQSGPQLLPGFPVMSRLNLLGMEDQFYEKQLTFPVSFIKRLTVTVILNRNITDADAENVRNIVFDILAIDLKRGDELVIVRAPFAPIWKTIWYTPETMGLLFKYVVLTFMSIIALIVVAICFLKLAGAMSTMAKAQQSHQISMEFGKSPAGAGMPGGEAGILEGGERLALPGRTAESGEEPREDAQGPASQEKVVFNVRPDQVDFLIPMLAREDPANVALVTAHLEPEIRKEFLKRLPVDTASEVLARMGKVRFVDPDVISTIKEELERRLQGAVGGVVKVLEIVEQANLKAKKEMLKRLQEKHPELARQVKSKILLVEDLARLKDRDISILASSMKLDDWSWAVWGMPDDLKEKVKSQMAEKSWQMIEQSMKYGTPPAGKIEKAVEDLVTTAARLVGEGRISNPLLKEETQSDSKPQIAVENNSSES